MVETVAFRSRDEARSIRTDRSIKPFLAERDDARTATVALKEDTPMAVLDDVTAQAADSRRDDAEKVGQVGLSDFEREQIDFTQTNVPAARSVKAKAVAEGVDFLSVFDSTLTVDENRALVEAEAGGRASQTPPGVRGASSATTGPYDGTDSLSSSEIDKSLARANEAVNREGLSRAKKFGFEQADADAREFVRESGPRSEVFDISLSRDESGILTGSGGDFGRLQDRHESRSQRAQTLDEKLSAPVTRDPFQWYDDPDEWDYPGIDTVQPSKLHAERSARAREIDNRESAPIADDRQQWALNPDRYDWPGVDTPGPSSGVSRDDVLDTSPDGTSQQGLGGGSVERDPQATFAVEVDDSAATRFMEESASSFGVDDRSDPSRGFDFEEPDFDDMGLEAFGGGARENERLDEMFR